MSDTTPLGRYILYEEIGHGSMGTVHRAWDPLLDRELAIKLMRTGPQVELEIKERFFREARACARLQHPNIVTIYDVGEYESIAYLAMERLQGMDCRRIIKERVPVPLHTKLECAVQLCEGLAHAHRDRIVHRDIKPSNLYLHQGRQLKILDFGLARMPESQLTLAGRVLGTPNYMAPEQIAGRDCDTRSDLFSAMIVLFEFLTGVHPFQAQFIPRRIAQGEPDSLREVAPALPAALAPVFDRGMAKDPSMRYESAENLAAEFRSVVAQLPPEGNVAGELTKSESRSKSDTDQETVPYPHPLNP